MNISVFSIHFVNYLALKYISLSLSLSCLNYSFITSWKPQAAATTAAHDQRTYLTSWSLGQSF